jgi:UMF1 family MFS transporter
MGKSAVILGPLLIGAVVLVSDSHRLGILSVSLLFIIGLVLLRLVDNSAEPSRDIKG